MRGVFLDTDTLDHDDLDWSPIDDIEDIEWSFHGITTAGDIDDRLAGCEIVVCNKVVIGREEFDRADNLRLVIVAATGTNNIDLVAAAERGITVCNVQGYSTLAVVQHVYALILALTTRLTLYVEAVRAGAWQRHPHFCFFDFPIRELSGLALGIVGYGNLGRGVAAVAPAFGLQVKVCQRPGGPAAPDRIALTDLLPQVDILSLHCPLTEHTRSLIGTAELSAMKKDAILINTARGGIVDEHALAEALKQGTLGGAGIDVLTEEPPVNGNVLLDPEIPNLIVTPHTAWASRQCRQRAIDLVGANIRAYLAGNPQNVV